MILIHRKRSIFFYIILIVIAIMFFPRISHAYVISIPEETKDNKETLTAIDPEKGDVLKDEEISFILNQIQTEYPDISKNSLEKVQEALSYVGNIGYSKNHHSCPLDGDCHLSDCSGFVSHIWETELCGIYTTKTFYNNFFNILYDFDNTAMPGDILLYYDGAADGIGDHALLYVGYLDLGNGDGYQYYTIDCTTSNGDGNVFFTFYGDDYVGHCVVLPMHLFQKL